MDFINDFITNIGIEVIRDTLKDSITEIAARKKLRTYIEQQNLHNINDSSQEEFDFGGLKEYILQELMDDIKERLWGNRVERGNARDRIIRKACSYASANTCIPRDRTMKIVGTAVDILRKYYRNRINKELRYIAGEIEDEIADQNKATIMTIHEETASIIKLMEENNSSSIENVFNKIANGDIRQVGDKMGLALNAISARHDLFPYYGFRMTPENKMISYPMTEEAKKLYPENYKISFTTTRLGHKTIREMDSSVFDLAYRHQLPVVINVKAAQKYLGNVLDPIQSEAEEMIGQQVIIKPPEFPKAFPCNVIVGEDVVVPFLLLRTKELLDDGTVIITNEEQENYPFNVVLRCAFSRNKVSFSVTLKRPSNKESLHYRQFLKRVLSGEQVTVNALSLNGPLLCGTVDQREYENLDAEISFLTKIVQIEDYFDTKITIPEVIEKEDHLVIDRLVRLINGSYSGTWNTFEFEFVLNEQAIERIAELTDDYYRLSYTGEASFKIFDAELKLSIIREIDCAKIDNLNKLKKKISVLDAGDKIKVKYISGSTENRGTYTDRIETSDLELGVLFCQKGIEGQGTLPELTRW